MNSQFLSNTYLVASGLAGDPGAAALFIDAGGPVQPLIAAADRLHLRPSHLLLTHHHYDHVSEADVLRERWPELQVMIGSAERGFLEGELAIDTIEPGATMQIGALRVQALPTPGHTAGMLSFHVQEVDVQQQTGTGPGAAAVFTGDTLFKGSVGGVHAPGHTSFADLKHSIMQTLMSLDPDTVIYPGHADASTVADEWERNGFIRLWRGVDGEQPRPCLAFERPAELILLADDYDGGHKAWVRWPDGSDDVLPGSRVQLT